MGRNYERTTGIRIRKTQETVEKVTFKCETTGFTKEVKIKEKIIHHGCLKAVQNSLWKSW